jgi:hypothetical protein
VFTITRMEKSPTPMVRFLCTVADHGPIADLALAFVDAFLDLGCQVRLLCTNVFHVDDTSRWVRHRPLLMTPMTSPFVNVVCTEARNIAGLYTVGVKNILLTCDGPADPKHVAAALRYEGLVVPASELGAAWSLAGGHPLVVPLPGLEVTRNLRRMLLE